MEDSILMDNRVNYHEWPLDMLIRYIEKEHHRYVREQSVFINSALTGAYKQSRLYEIQIIAREFARCTNRLTDHLQYEENVFFPCIKEVIGRRKKERVRLHHSFALLANEHEFDFLPKIQVIYDAFECLAGKYNDHHSLMLALNDFNSDLKFHIALEDRILFKFLQQ